VRGDDSEQFRRRSGQTFTTSTPTVRLKVNGGRVYLTQRPVTSVTSVVDSAGAAVTYTHAGQWLTIDSASTSCSSDAFVTVTYAAGGAVPDVVRLRIADIARRILMIPATTAGGSTKHSETRGPFSVSDEYAAWAVGGQTMLSPDDSALADSYRVRVPSVVVMRP